jgi:hypothetical protein
MDSSFILEQSQLAEGKKEENIINFLNLGFTL